MPLSEPEALRALLVSARTIAVVGYSDRPGRASRQIGQYLRTAGYTVYAVNPLYTGTVDDLPCYPSVLDLPEAVDIVDVFRRPEFVPEIVEQSIARGAKAVWLQFDVIHAEAAARAEAAGLHVVMDRCILVDHQRLVGKL